MNGTDGRPHGTSHEDQRTLDQLRSRERQAVGYVRDKTNQLLQVMGTLPLRPEELDDDTLFALDPLGIVGEAFDQVLQHLRETNAELVLARDEIRAIFDAAGAAILVVGQDGRIVACNARSQELFEAAEPLIGRTCRETVCRGAVPAGGCLLEQILARGERCEESDFVLGERHFHVVGSPLAPGNGQPAQVAMVYTDLTARRRMEQDLLETRQRLETILASVHAGILLIDAATHRIVEANDMALQMIGAPRQGVIGAECHRFICAADCGACPITDLGQTVDNAERWLLQAGGGRLPVLKTVTSVQLDGRRHLLESFIDLSERKRAEAALRASEERYRSLYVHMHEGVALCELVYAGGQRAVDYRILDVNPAYARQIGREREQILGRLGSEIACLPVPPHLETFVAVAEGRESTAFESDCAVADRQFHVSVFSPAPGRFAAVFEDITERKRAHREMERLAYFDVLTGLPNRSLFRDRLEQALALAARQERKLALMFLDLDQFKEINDTFGHSGGDRLLQVIAGRLTAEVRKSDTVARLGGDEFVLILSGVESEPEASVSGTAHKVLESLSRPVVLDGREIFVTGSLGIALFPDDGEDAETLIRNADAAMYEAKERGNTCQFYTAAMNAQALERLLLNNDLRRALERREFFLLYQPQYDVVAGRMIGVEALVRWRHPDLGVLLPSQFVPLAEETGLILPLGRWVLETACAQAAAWQQEGPSSLRVAVNLSARQFREPGLAAVIAEALAGQGLDGSNLELEITESVLLENVAATRSVLADLKAMGIRLAIDDFGTGYSSLSYLKHFPIHCLKIDRSFVHDLPAQPDDAAIAEAILALARSLGLEVVAEGVETPQQYDWLRARGCSRMQGFHFGRPEAAGAIAARLRQEAAGRRG